MVLSLCITYNTANKAAGRLRVAGERGWLTTTKQVIILLFWLLKSSLVEITLWWAFSWDTNNFIFFFFLQIQRHLYMKLFKFPCHQFSNYVSTISLTVQPIHWLNPMNWHIIAHLIFSPSKNRILFGNKNEWKKLENIILHEMKCITKNAYYMISFMWNV